MANRDTGLKTVKAGEKARKGSKSARAKPAPKLARRPKTLTRKRPATSAYRRELRTRTDDTVMADIQARVEAASRIRDEIAAKIERGLAEDRAGAGPAARGRGWLR